MNTKRKGLHFRSLLFGLLFFLPISIFASFDEGLHGARQGALAQTICAMPNTIENISFNPAAIWTTSKLSSHFFYSKPYDLPNVKTGTFFATLSQKPLTMGFGFTTFGNENYNESTLSFATSFKVNESLFLGGTVRYGHLDIKGYGNTGTVLFDGGVLIRVFPQLYWGSTIRNMTNSKMGETDEELAQFMATGLHYKPAPPIAANIDIVKEIRYPVDVRTGVEFQLHKNLILRTGLSSNPQKISAGLGFDFKQMGIDYGFNSHSVLGFTHLFSVWFKLKR